MLESHEQETWVMRAWRSPSIAVAILDEQFKVTRANDTFVQLAGRRAVVGRTLISFVCTGHRDLALPLLGYPAPDAPVRVGMFPNADGIPLDVELSLVPSGELEHRTILIEPLLGPPTQALTEVMRLNEELGETQRRLQAKNLEIEAALRDVKESHLYIRKLEGILPMCMNCRSVRDDKDNWTTLDAYLVASNAIMLSHGLCPICLEAALEGMEADA